MTPTCPRCDTPVPRAQLCDRCFADELADRDFDEEPDDPLQDAIDECGFIPSEGLCTLAGTEWCDWDCPFNPCDPEGI